MLVGATDHVVERRADEPDRRAGCDHDGVGPVGGDRGRYGAQVGHSGGRGVDVADRVGHHVGAIGGGSGVVAGVDVVVARAGDDGVADALEPPEAVSAVVVGLAVDRVVVRSPRDAVGTLAATDEVVAAQTGDLVVALPAPDHVALRRTSQVVGPRVADDGGLLPVAGRGRGVRGGSQGQDGQAQRENCGESGHESHNDLREWPVVGLVWAEHR